MPNEKEPNNKPLNPQVQQNPQQLPEVQLVKPPPFAQGDPSVEKPMELVKFKRVLVVEDSADDRMIIKHYLSADGRYTATIVSDPLLALQKLRSGEQFDLIITDYEMPHMKGDGFIAAAKDMLKDTPMKNVPFILSTRFDKVDISKFPAKPNGVIFKTFTPDEMKTIAKLSGADQLPE